MKHFSVFASLILSLVLAVSGCSRSPARPIENVLNQCAKISADANALHANSSTTAGYVADHMQTIDTSACPQDFREAFQIHINAWREAQNANARNTLDNALVEGAVAEIRQDSSGIGAAASAADAANQDINATYYQVTEIAAKYGAKIPRSAVNQ